MFTTLEVRKDLGHSSCLEVYWILFSLCFGLTEVGQDGMQKTKTWKNEFTGARMMMLLV